MEGTNGKGLKRSGKVRSKDTLLKEKVKKRKSLIKQATNNENVMKVTHLKTVVKTDSKSDDKIKIVKNRSKTSPKKNMKLKSDKKNYQKSKKTMESQEDVKKTLESKELKVAEWKKTKSLIKNKKLKITRPTESFSETHLQTDSIDEITKKNQASVKQKLEHKEAEREEIPIVQSEATKPQAKRMVHLGYLLRKAGFRGMAQMRKKTKLSRRVRKGTKKPDPLTMYAENDGSEVFPGKVSQAVEALLKLLDDSEKKLFSDEGKDIYLYIKCIKIPMTPPREVRIVLPHSLLPEKPDVCLFSSDLRKGKRIDHEPTLKHVKDILRKHGITEISEVISLKQLKTEYDQYELKRALCSRFDFFLSDAKVCGHIVHLLGKTFYSRKKIPVPIKLDSKNLKKCVQTALHKTSFRLTNNLMLHLKVAHTNMTPEQIQENIIAVTDALHKDLPGGWNNVACLTIRGVQTIPVPFYVSTLNENKVPRLKIEPRRPNASRNVSGDLPGIGLLRVRPDGHIKILQREYEEHENEDNLPHKRVRLSESAIKQDSDESDGEATENIEMDDGGDDENEVEDKDKENEFDRDKDDNVHGEDADGSDVSENESSGEENSGLHSMEAAYLNEWMKNRALQKIRKKQSNKNR